MNLCHLAARIGLPVLLTMLLLLLLSPLPAAEAAGAAGPADAGTPPAAPAAAAAPAAGEHAEMHVSPDLHEVLAIPQHGRTYAIMIVLFELAAMLIAAKLLGWAAERIRVPGVIGELMAGVIIGPYLLGSLIKLPLHGTWVPLFPRPTSPDQWPLSEIVWAFAQFASIILLFITGLHTDLKQFLKYIAPATLVAVVGVVLPFGLGVGTVYIPYFAAMAPATEGQPLLVPALFVGAILAATSIGITARVLGDLGRLDTPEGVTILGAAVLDDVLGIIALAIVAGIAAAWGRGDAAEAVSGAQIAWIAVKAFGVWIALTGVVLLLATRIERFIGSIRYSGAVVALGLALAFICSGVAEFFGLAFIIGAYSVGLGLSRTKLAHKLMDELKPVADFIVPIFFAALGMLVNLEAMLADWNVIIFGLVITVAAVIGKLVGCGAAALPVGFNMRGAYRVGLGMMPRGEVALIVAGVGLSQRIIGQTVFGVSIMMTLLTTIVAPILLVPAFAKGGSGRRRPEEVQRKLPSVSQLPGLIVPVPTDLAEALLDRLVGAAEKAGWVPAYERADEDIYLLRSRGDAAQLRLEDGSIRIDASDTRQAEFVDYLTQVRRELGEQAAAMQSRPAPLAEAAGTALR